MYKRQALSSGGSMLERLQLVDELQEGDPLEEESLQQLQAWLYGNDGELCIRDR